MRGWIGQALARWSCRQTSPLIASPPELEGAEGGWRGWKARAAQAACGSATPRFTSHCVSPRARGGLGSQRWLERLEGYGGSDGSGSSEGSQLPNSTIPLLRFRIRLHELLRATSERLEKALHTQCITNALNPLTVYS
ncbi:hypothetical protein NDU88_002523 [Pleurodeles waltl]|uniref:Uncharacterized protein n=1 Tax=Pleurodeles waltl TaxID=8319 RepID=A0AAV7NFN8_PLEWA|nr:hypothetical protein NDU88_002523 [Pleurodeles waltl]